MLRRATLQDAAATKRFRERILAEGLETIFKGNAPSLESQERWHERFENDPNSALFVYLDGDDVVGLLGFESFASTPQCRHAGAFGVSVLESHRGQGIGRQLIEALIDWAETHDEVRRLELEVLGNNPRALALYARLGFEIEGHKKNAVEVEGGYVDSIVMTRWVQGPAKSDDGAPEPALNLRTLELTTHDEDGFRQAYADISDRLGAKRLGYNLTVVQPGDVACALHSHRVTEEAFVVLRGTGTLQYGGSERALEPNDVIACPPGGRDVAHQIINTGKTELAYLAISTRDACDVVEYPDSNELGVFTSGSKHITRLDMSTDRGPSKL